MYVCEGGVKVSEGWVKGVAGCRATGFIHSRGGGGGKGGGVVRGVVCAGGHQWVQGDRSRAHEAQALEDELESERAAVQQVCVS